MTAISVRGLSKSFGGGPAALENVTLEIERGSICAIVGSNGAGKTTLLRVLATLLRPSAGHAYVCGYDTVSHGGEVRRLVGYVPDSFGLYGDLKVWEYLEFFADCYGLRHPGTTITELVTLVDLHDQRRSYISTLSRGMRQRLLLARALLHDPEVLLLDEPTSGLDPQGRDDVIEVLRELQRLDKTMVVSTHFLADVQRMCTDVAVMAGGRLVLHEAVDQVALDVRAARRVRLEVVNDPERARVVLGRFGAIRDVVSDDQVISFTFDGTRYEMPDILEELVAQQIKVVTFAEERGELETALGRAIAGPTVEMSA